MEIVILKVFWPPVEHRFSGRSSCRWIPSSRRRARTCPARLGTSGCSGPDVVALPRSVDAGGRERFLFCCNRRERIVRSVPSKDTHTDYFSRLRLTRIVRSIPSKLKNSHNGLFSRRRLTRMVRSIPSKNTHIGHLSRWRLTRIVRSIPSNDTHTGHCSRRRLTTGSAQW